MKNVKRTSIPQSLKDNAETWTQELINMIEKCTEKGTKVPKKYYDKYNQSDIKKALFDMYNGLCCYCEGATGRVEFGHIEHRMPKKKFPNKTYDWDNLHLACTRCNTYKGQKYLKQYPILDAVEDKISDHRKYEVKPRGVWWTPKTERANTTQKHVKLNEDSLPKDRLDTLNASLETIMSISENPDAPGVDVAIEQLKELTKGNYGSVIEFVMKRLLPQSYNIVNNY